MKRAEHVRVTLETKEMLELLKQSTGLSYPKLIHAALQLELKRVNPCKWCGRLRENCECKMIEEYMFSEDE
jgi:hypothetical protein